MGATHTVLSLDLGTTLGWCIARDNQILVSGVKSFYQKDAHPGKKLIDFLNWLQQFKNIDEIFFENVTKHMSVPAMQTYESLRGILYFFSYSCGVHITGMHPMSVKKIFTGNGKADKRKICEHAHHLGWKGGIKDTDDHHDEADACAIYYAIMHRRGIEITFAPQQ